MNETPFIRTPMTGHRQMTNPNTTFRRPAVAPASDEAATVARYQAVARSMEKKK